ncbi:MAG: hypothetical protein FK734_17905 [Asgard group archaeon]|nr:hypothetical protein [Asgard group archaeon]
MKLLVSPQTLTEALECIKGGADIIDVKNPHEGSLGANFPWVIRNIRQATPASIPISATLGNVQYTPGSVALAALGAVIAGASYVKVGLLGVKTIQEAVDVMTAVKKTTNEFKFPTLIVAAGYAEGEAIRSLNPLDIPEVSKKASCDVAMIDTFDKTTGKSLFDHLSINDLSQFIADSRDRGLMTALGGSINANHLPQLKKLAPDIIGIRGAVCDSNDRIHGFIKAELIAAFVKKMQE